MSVDHIVALKKGANVALNSGNYWEAVRHYSNALDQFADVRFRRVGDDGLIVNTWAVDHSRLESTIYGKRSVALLKLHQYYYAFEDAKQVVEISPEWFKGYLRKGDVQLDCGLFHCALKDYQLALRYLHRESKKSKEEQYKKFIDQKIKHILFMIQREQSFDYQIPWVGAALGMVIGMAIVTWDYVSNGTDAYVNHPILKLACIGVVAYVFFHLASFQRSLNRKYKQEMLKPPYRSHNKHQ